MSDSNHENNGKPGSNGNNGSGEPPRPPKPITDRDRMGINFEMNVQPPPPPPAPPPLPPDDDPRASKKLELSEAVSRYLPDGIESVVMGGMHMHNNPMALVREIIRQKKRIKRLITSPAACINADLLIGAGLVEEVVTPYIGFEHLGLAPAFRRLAQDGGLRVLEVDELVLLAGLRAGAAGQPFVALPPGVAFSDVARLNPEFYRPTTDPFTGQPALVAPAIRPRLALVAAQQTDKLGNVVFKGSVFFDREMMLASAATLLQVEQVVLHSSLTRQPLQVTVPGYYVQAVVEAPFGCHPTASHRFYHYDEPHLKEYLRLAATPEGFEEYLQRYVYTGSEDDYLARSSVGAG